MLNWQSGVFYVLDLVFGLNSLSAEHIWWNFLFLDQLMLPGAWVAELLGVVLGVQDHKKIKFPMATIVAKIIL